MTSLCGRHPVVGAIGHIEPQLPRATSLVRTTMRSVCLSALFAAAPVVAIAGPKAASGAETFSSTVSLASLDLTIPAGQRAAQHQLSAAAIRLCRKFWDDREVSNGATMADCYQETLEKALQHLSAQVAVAMRGAASWRKTGGNICRVADEPRETPLAQVAGRRAPSGGLAAQPEEIAHEERSTAGSYARFRGVRSYPIGWLPQ